MRQLTAQWVANAVGGTLVADVDVRVDSVEKDTRDVEPGALYAAFIGDRVDGHDYVDQAIAAGATLCLVQHPVGAPHIMVDDVTEALGRLARAYLALLRVEGDLTVIGITGSNGKTTTKDLLAQVLPDVVAPVGSFNNEIGLPLTVLRADASTRHLVLEMGASAPGDIAYLTSIAPLDIAVVLTVGSAHVGGYGNIEALAAEKSTIIDGVIPGGTVLLNADDGRVAGMRDVPAVHDKSLTVRTFGATEDAEVSLIASRARLVDGRAEFTPMVQASFASSASFHDPDDPGQGGGGSASDGFVDGAVPYAIHLGLVGEHHVTNALAAIAVGLTCGMEYYKAIDAVAAARPLSAHRMAVTTRADGVTVIDDSYNASPESMRAALRALMAVGSQGRTFAVIGEMLEMGEASIDAHNDIGLDVVRLGVDHLLVVGDGARPAFTSAVREGSWGDEAAWVATIEEARTFVDERLAAGDTVLVKASHGAGLWKLADQLVGVNE
ncbi:UDP-N-acetylmuramoyl-tripeptide--D-alanyl-D-alanine ligase [Demequina aurantiaca]|uniref:UDP-N-acetylmuramoyl-tripeptide--D-alanyl-D- alanine ligase n=1 Tax=Demequina aurantiaca TaxID=676200 RepID=UPI000780DFCA|nr:UDP-N-acetylmuramoyl-tripeptide--D-alanyl-D-alanine ligase [Demequina aurantiaca]